MMSDSQLAQYILFVLFGLWQSVHSIFMNQNKCGKEGFHTWHESDNGKWNGLEVQWFDWGDISLKQMWVNGKRHGRCLEFDVSGQIKTESWWIQDKRVKQYKF